MRLIINLFIIKIFLLLEFSCDVDKESKCENYRKIPYKDSIVDCSALCCGYEYFENSLGEINFDIINFTYQDIEVFVNNFKLSDSVYVRDITKYDLRNLIPLKNYSDTIIYFEAYFKTKFTSQKIMRDTLIDKEFYIDTTRENKIKIRFQKSCEEIEFKIKKYSSYIIIFKDTVSNKFIVFYNDCWVE